MPGVYRSSIPKEARERVVERHSNGSKKKAEYLVDDEIVGVREFTEAADLDYEFALKNGKKHGVEYRWSDPGGLLSAEPYANGFPHGTARQWSSDGKLIGTYTMVRGTGIDLWRGQQEDGSVYLAEVHYMKAGFPHGFEWYLREDQATVFIERHWQNGHLHGVEREWNSRGRLHRGYPRYYVNDDKVTKRQYLKACASDPTLPRWRAEDNDPARYFPAEIVREMLQSKDKRQ
jgi:antitoxin component YwqK of YwqJK toxin-antitoxin module